MKVIIELNHHLLDKTVENAPKQSIKPILSAICGGWFLLTSWLWTYLINLVISYPVAILGIILWYSARQSNPSSRWAKLSLYLHVIGLASSLLTLLLFIIFN